MSAGLRPRRLAGTFLALAGVLSLAACSLPGVNATPDAAAILKNVQAVQINDAQFNISYSGKLSAGAQQFFESQFGLSLTGTFSGNGQGAITSNPQRADITFNVPIGTSGAGVAVQVLYDGATKTLYAGGPGVFALFGSLIGANSKQAWFQLSLNQIGGFDVSQFLNVTQLLNVSLVDANPLNGVPAYHLQGTESSNGVSATIDLYVRQDNYNPVRAAISLNTVVVGTATLDFYGINTSTPITPPSSDQIFNS